MALRFDDAQRTLRLSVRDLVTAGPPSGHLVLSSAQRAVDRMASGREAHALWQSRQQAADPNYLPEVPLQHTLQVGDWTVELAGRADGITVTPSGAFLEEVKATALPARQLYQTTLASFPGYVNQLEVYLWLYHLTRGEDPLGQLVLLSLLDGSRHLLPVPFDPGEVAAFVHRRLGFILRTRERYLAWMAARRAQIVPLPFPTWRPGQEDLSARATQALEQEHPLLVAAPTGIGKTAAVLHGVLRYAFAHDKRVFWCTSRNTQRAGVLQTLDRFRAQGLRLRRTVLPARQASCLQPVMACRPDLCPHAEGYYDKREDHDVMQQVEAAEGLLPEDARATGEQLSLCPAELLLDASERVDVVIGDVHHALHPTGHVKRLFGPEHAGDWIVVVDEVHQLPERARGWASPRLPLQLIHAAHAQLEEHPVFEAFRQGVAEARDRVLGRLHAHPQGDPTYVSRFPADLFTDVLAQLDELSLEYALHRSTVPVEHDHFLELHHRLRTFQTVLAEEDPEMAHLVTPEGDQAGLQLLCLDAAPHLAARFEGLGGLLGCSATLKPAQFFQRTLGLPQDDHHVVEVDSPFPREHQAVWVAPWVSTAYKDRDRDRAATRKLLEEFLRGTPGHAALFFSSFDVKAQLLHDLDVGSRVLLDQHPAMATEARTALLAQLDPDAPPAVLTAVLGGAFAEGVDLPGGALRGIAIVGPALPPVGLPLQLLADSFERRFGEGYPYAAWIPGMTKVVQAAGRLVRSPTDRGCILLVGRRFRWRQAFRCFPSSWQATVPQDLPDALTSFWRTHDAT